MHMGTETERATPSQQLTSIQELEPERLQHFIDCVTSCRGELPIRDFSRFSKERLPILR